MAVAFGLASKIIGKCTFWTSPDQSKFMIHNPDIDDLLRQTTELEKIGYVLVGGIIPIPVADRFEGFATFELADWARNGQ